ncbi:MAG: NDP-sugar synthase [Verrucomicrobiales bacterium]
MEKPTLMVLAAGMGSRYGGLKQMDPMGPNGETVLDYSVFDALRGGFGRVVFVIRRDFEQAFRDGVGAKFCDRVPVEYAFQSLDDLPSGFTVPDGREKPWGTAHAIRAARDLVNGPFAVINADDFYGRDAYVQLGQFLSEPRDETTKGHFAMVGFELRRTLSDFGSVARGICRANAEGYLESVVEMTKIFKTNTGAENREDGAAPIPLTGGELVSMNMWGFTPALVPLLESKFIEFLSAKGRELKSEAYIPMVVDELIREGKADTRMLPTSSEWFGVTYREDKPQVMASIARLIEAGEYPANLWG